MHLKFCISLTTAVIIIVLAGKTSLEELHFLAATSECSVCIGYYYMRVLRRKPLQDAWAPGDP